MERTPGRIEQCTSTLTSIDSEPLVKTLLSHQVRQVLTLITQEKFSRRTSNASMMTSTPFLRVVPTAGHTGLIDLLSLMLEKHSMELLSSKTHMSGSVTPRSHATTPPVKPSLDYPTAAKSPSLKETALPRLWRDKLSFKTQEPNASHSH